MPRIKVTRTYVAHVTETTHVFMDVPEGQEPEDFILDIEADNLADDLLERAEDDAVIQYDNDDPEDGPVARERAVFVGTDQCHRTYNWDINNTECEVVE